MGDGLKRAEAATRRTRAPGTEKLAGYRVRVCRTLHECCLCSRGISLGEVYYDGGYGRRAHVLCVGARNP